jgi:hypothetical protein
VNSSAAHTPISAPVRMTSNTFMFARFVRSSDQQGRRRKFSGIGHGNVVRRERKRHVKPLRKSTMWTI